MWQNLNPTYHKSRIFAQKDCLARIVYIYQWTHSAYVGYFKIILRQYYSYFKSVLPPTYCVCLWKGWIQWWAVEEEQGSPLCYSVQVWLLEHKPWCLREEKRILKYKWNVWYRHRPGIINITLGMANAIYLYSVQMGREIVSLKLRTERFIIMKWIQTLSKYR